MTHIEHTVVQVKTNQTTPTPEQKYFYFAFQYYSFLFRTVTSALHLTTPVHLLPQFLHNFKLGFSVRRLVISLEWCSGCPCVFCLKVVQLQVDWPSPLPAQKRSEFTELFLSLEKTTVKSHLPLFLDFVPKQAMPWSKQCLLMALYPAIVCWAG